MLKGLTWTVIQRVITSVTFQPMIDWRVTTQVTNWSCLYPFFNQCHDAWHKPFLFLFSFCLSPIFYPFIHLHLWSNQIERERFCKCHLHLEQKSNLYLRTWQKARLFISGIEFFLVENTTATRVSWVNTTYFINLLKFSTWWLKLQWPVANPL